MDFTLTEQQRIFCDSVSAFARKELAAGALARAHTPEFPREVARLMAGAGLMGITIPEADGGTGGAPIDAVVAIEQGAPHFSRNPRALAESSFRAVPGVAPFGTPDPKRRYLGPPLAGPHA